jgi:hypothetical protein
VEGGLWDLGRRQAPFSGLKLGDARTLCDGLHDLPDAVAIHSDFSEVPNEADIGKKARKLTSATMMICQTGTQGWEPGWRAFPALTASRHASSASPSPVRS